MTVLWSDLASWARNFDRVYFSLAASCAASDFIMAKGFIGGGDLLAPSSLSVIMKCVGNGGGPFTWVAGSA